MRSFAAIFTAALFATLAAAGPAGERDPSMASMKRNMLLDKRDYDCGSCALGSAVCNGNNAPGCATGDCACCCAAISNSAPTASLPPVGKR